jgi:primosomal protein N' (replication factor Y)
LIVIDEEHENSFKQQQVPRYHARDVALMRARFEGAAVVLGSATPSLETFHNARRDKLTLLTLTQRMAGGRWPDSRVVDLSLQMGNRRGLVSDSLYQALLQTLARREQAILFLNRRGYSPAAYCGHCKASVPCKSCSVPLTLHRRSNRLLCHYCGHEMVPPRLCPICKSVDVHYLGAGTEKIEDEVKRILPEARVARMDSDTTAARGSHEAILGAFGRGEIDILVGTQMIAKGLDFPRVTLVGVLMADAALSIPDFRAAERTFGLIAQVTGRAGRSERGGLVVVQAFAPAHFAIRSALAHDYTAFAERELEMRRAGNYPPYSHLVRLVLSGKKDLDVTQAAAEIRHDLEPLASEHGVDLLGPAPAPIARLAGSFRHHLLLRATRRKALRPLLLWLAQKRLPRKVKLIVDVDPQSMM